MPLLQALLHFCKAIPEGVTLAAKGELLNVTFRIANGVSDSGKQCTNPVHYRGER
jgi:hypothetical protein